MFHTQSSQRQSTVTVQPSPHKEKIMSRKSIAIVIASLCATLLFSACVGPRVVVDLSAVYAASTESAGLPELADRQAPAEYMATLSPGFAFVNRAEIAMQNHFLAELQSQSGYQGTPPYLIAANSLMPIRQPAPLMLNDRQDVADYQMFISGGYGQ